jgi:hypothetical protein
VANTSVDLYWLPLGAGGHSVRYNGRVYEFVVAAAARRPRCDLYHSALEVSVPAGRFVIETAPIPDTDGHARGVVAEGPVGSRLAARLRLFRYELRCWQDGEIPDVAEAVDSPLWLGADLGRALALLELVPRVPMLVWGRDELRVGEMWNSNSVIAWLLARGGFDVDSINPPSGGRAPGWHAGLVASQRPGGAPQPRRRWRSSSGSR